MRTIRTLAPLVGIALVSFVLSGCSAGGDESSAGTPQAELTGVTAPADTGTEPEAGAACPTVPQEGYELFTSDAVTAAPADGQVYGGTDHPISWTFADAQALTPSVDFSYVNEAGEAIPMGGIFLEDWGSNEWGSSLDVFTSDAADRPGFAVLTVTYDASADGNGEISGTTEVVGVYCVTFHVTP